MIVILDDSDQILISLKDKMAFIFDQFDEIQVLDQEKFLSLKPLKRNDLLFVNATNFFSHRDKFNEISFLANTFTAVFYFFEDQLTLEEQSFFDQNVIILKNTLGIYPISLSPTNMMNLTAQLNFLHHFIEDQFYLQKKLMSVDGEIDFLLDKAKGEMEKLKHLHQKTIPMRHEKIKGIDFLHKFQVGDGVGAEYFDLITENHKLYEILFSSSSYLLSSTFIDILANHKNKFDPDFFLNEMLLAFKAVDPQLRDDDYNYFIFEIDPTDLKAEIHSNKKIEIYRQNTDQFYRMNQTSLGLVRGDRVLIFSDGFSANWNSSEVNVKLEKYLNLKNMHHLSSNDLMNELFFQVNEGLKKSTLKKDSTVMMVEVSRYGIYEV